MTAAERTLAKRLASDQPEQALRLAQAIGEPWFRCQALSYVARYWPDNNYDRILAEAVRSADLQDEIYRQVAVSAWPIRSYLERDNAYPAQVLLTKYIRMSHLIPNMGSRAEALLLLFQASKPFAPGLWHPVFDALVNAAEPSLSWRQGRALRYAAAMVVSDDRRLIQNAVQRLSDEKHLRALATVLGSDSPDRSFPRTFFVQI